MIEEILRGIRLIESDEFKKADLEDIFEFLIFANHSLIILRERPE
jgi:hypothetical protein